ncbi:MAG: hypothetical protein AUH81_07180 [Candidatus Rokubacteria bacterium 13_1_40CM_4_69_5]|nr:MAG: hypothetical protein AUH81_07180 [Candidatus Rokubacteria bacterium 13_1_40CM_4_69_5]
MIFDALAVRLNGSKAAGKVIRLNYVFPDTNERLLVRVENGVLNYWAGKQAPQADATVTLTRPMLNQIIVRTAGFEQKISAGEVQIEGRREALDELLSLIDTFAYWFNIVTPRPPHP